MSVLSSDYWISTGPELSRKKDDRVPNSIGYSQHVQRIVEQRQPVIRAMPTRQLNASAQLLVLPPKFEIRTISHYANCTSAGVALFGFFLLPPTSNRVKQCKNHSLVQSGQKAVEKPTKESKSAHCRDALPLLVQQHSDTLFQDVFLIQPFSAVVVAA